jgi:hypothetical protein
MSCRIPQVPIFKIANTGDVTNPVVIYDYALPEKWESAQTVAFM